MGNCWSGLKREFSYQHLATYNCKRSFEHWRKIYQVIEDYAWLQLKVPRGTTLDAQGHPIFKILHQYNQQMKRHELLLQVHETYVNRFPKRTQKDMEKYVDEHTSEFMPEKARKLKRFFANCSCHSNVG